MRLTTKNTLLAGVLAAFGTTAILSAPVLAGGDDVVVEDAWSRASIGTNRPGAAYMTIRNTSDEVVTLTSIRTDLAMMPEIHQTSTNAEGVSSMAPAGELEIAPGGSVALEPGGLHAMLMRLQRPMTEGESFALTLIFADGAEKTVNIPIFGIAARGPEN
ncbi:MULTISPECIES: copper chaperone PCu(A)C [Ruegeria]|jgi:copper(I)-binding protein|uniref:Copper chaperone PCu(A)C n=1 Tax=Ruegeria atlantica TaxID=81569 RepID=A0AA90Z528_9RHOB|nr:MULTISPECIES: copper chaperone PCu(A)C [Ruegeria]MBO9448248.1 copper chaperone PCu(A)C [Ruegeria sp. R14_0]NOD90788.1 copper chaperone PCu(A)C [Ruegeria sp. HKCCD4318]NOE16090.1 copper chaperone PCu(A)C [Ruegeria sp. HKCCD4318-2]NOE20406.1 copper chaperone PCu(A)C [Ruegeria atlantica]NOG11657.1 copper chaperone PCu(A)C [Ruegeria sp. HKCCD4315]